MKRAISFTTHLERNPVNLRLMAIGLRLKSHSTRTFCIFFLTLLLTTITATSQDCEVYVPYDEGTELTYTNFNAKGKKLNDTKQKLVSKTNEGNVIVFGIRQEILEDKKEPIISNFKYKCDGNRFIFDMESFVSEEQKKSMGNAKIDMVVDAIDIPSGVAPGMTLKDGSITMKVQSESPVNMSLKVLITNRKIDAIESVTTPAGTFSCIKISQDITTNMGFIKVTVRSVSWMSKNTGVIKSETYSKDKKLMGSMILQNIAR